MKRKYFGTDGIRGAYGVSVLTDAFAARLGGAVAQWIRADGEALTIAIGRDTRASGPALLNAFARGLQSESNIRVVDLGALPTPAIAVSVRNVGATLGVAITASHNPAQDNGIKFFNSLGKKLTDSQELEIESLVDRIELPDTLNAPQVEVCSSGILAYLDLLRPTLPEGSLKGFRIVVDTANGAACNTTPALLKELGAELFVYGNEPNGLNINEGVGSQYPNHLSEKVLGHQAHLGIAHDGDADRLLICDESGKVVSGDRLLGLLALHESKHGRLEKNTLVATKQSNIGLDHTLGKAGVSVVRTSIGDRHVLEEMSKSGYNLGGESSGHVIVSDINSTGDGLAAALKLLAILVEEGRPLSELQSRVTLFPQISQAIEVVEKKPLEDLAEIQSVLDGLESEIGEAGRVLLRYSGTENKIRLLVEGEDADAVEAWYQQLETVVCDHLT